MDCLARIKELLDERGWSMYQLARKANIQQSTLSNLFIRNNAPTIPTLEKICDAFGITLVEFFGGNENLRSQEEKEFLVHWNKLPKESRSAFLTLLKTFED